MFILITAPLCFLWRDIKHTTPPIIIWKEKTSYFSLDQSDYQLQFTFKTRCCQSAAYDYNHTQTETRERYAVLCFRECVQNSFLDVETFAIKKESIYVFRWRFKFYLQVSQSTHQCRTILFPGSSTSKQPLTEQLQVRQKRDTHPASWYQSGRWSKSRSSRPRGN